MYDMCIKYLQGILDLQLNQYCALWGVFCFSFYHTVSARAFSHHYLPWFLFIFHNLDVLISYLSKILYHMKVS